MALPLTSESSTVLRACASALGSGQLAPPVSKMALSRVARCSDILAAELLRLSSEGMAAAHMALLLDVAADAVEARGAAAASIELVWTGPEASASHSRDTSVVVEEPVSEDKAERATWHAKCILVDDDVAFVTSANFTE